MYLSTAIEYTVPEYSILYQSTVYCTRVYCTRVLYQSTVPEYTVPEYTVPEYTVPEGRIPRELKHQRQITTGYHSAAGSNIERIKVLECQIQWWASVLQKVTVPLSSYFNAILIIR